MAKMSKQEVLEACINKELNDFGIDYNFVMKNPELGGVPWYQHLTFSSPQEYDTWKSFCIALFRKELKHNKAMAEREFQWLDLSFGLKQSYLTEHCGQDRPDGSDTKDKQGPAKPYHSDIIQHFRDLPLDENYRTEMEGELYRAPAMLCESITDRQTTLQYSLGHARELLEKYRPK